MPHARQQRRSAAGATKNGLRSPGISRVHFLHVGSSACAREAKAYAAQNDASPSNKLMESGKRCCKAKCLLPHYRLNRRLFDLTSAL
jgi:hypothetical protein